MKLLENNLFGVVRVLVSISPTLPHKDIWLTGEMWHLRVQWRVPDKRSSSFSLLWDGTIMLLIILLTSGDPWF